MRERVEPWKEKYISCRMVSSRCRGTRPQLWGYVFGNFLARSKWSHGWVLWQHNIGIDFFFFDNLELCLEDLGCRQISSGNHSIWGFDSWFFGSHTLQDNLIISKILMWFVCLLISFPVVFIAGMFLFLKSLEWGSWIIYSCLKQQRTKFISSENQSIK